MEEKLTLWRKVTNGFLIFKSVRLVWQASPGWTTLNLLFIAVKGLMPLLMLYLMKLIVDNISSAISTPDGMRNLGSITLLIIFAGLAQLFTSAINHLSSYGVKVQSLCLRDHIYNVIHKKSTEVDLAYFEAPEYFDSLYRAQAEGPYRPQRIVNGLIQTAQNTITLAAMMGLLTLLHWTFPILMILATLPSLFFRFNYAGKEDELQKKHTANQRRSSYINSIITSEKYAKEIRLFETGEFFRSLFQELRNLIRGEQLTLNRHKIYAETAASCFSIILLALCFYLIAKKTLAGMITLGDMVMYYQAFQRGLNNLQTLVRNLAVLYEDNLFVQYLFDFLNLKNQVKDPGNPLPLPERQATRLVLQDVYFKYPGRQRGVLNGLSMVMERGENVALVGANGAGKTTLVKLVCRLYDPDSGTISMDGVQYTDVLQSELRRNITTVFQDYVHYHLTVRDNIWLGDIDSPAEESAILKAAKLAGAEKFIRSLPEGMDTLLGKGFAEGTELSLGEWQKIAISRAFMRKAPLIILDEPASSLDPASEYQMFTQFRRLMLNRTALLISHRLSTVQAVDRIFFLSEGKISESGTHKELMAAKGEYAEMFLKQQSLFDGSFT